SSLEQEILEALRKLSPEKQRRVLDYTRSLTRPKGTPGKLAVQYAREINFPAEDLAEMTVAIEAFCEVVEDIPEIDLDA
ncbi:MAG: hypothetical protein D6737_01415, partial [Chloroflexi bacterium]